MYPSGLQPFPTPPIRDHRSSTVDFLEINRGESVKFAKYGGETEEAYINAADEKGGVVFALVDPAKMKVERTLTTDAFGNNVQKITRIPNTKAYTVPWNFGPVPGLTEKGIYLTTYAGASLYFLGTTDNIDRNRYRLCVVTSLSETGLPPSSPFLKILPTRPVTGVR